MGHCIEAILGRRETVQAFADDWDSADVTGLPQDYGMVFLTDALFDGITERSGLPDRDEFPALTYFTTAIRQALENASRKGPLIYFETDYAGGFGTQAGLLLKNGKAVLGPLEGPGAVNQLLAALGVRCENGKDEFDSLTLGLFRHPPGF